MEQFHISPSIEQSDDYFAHFNLTDDFCDVISQAAPKPPPTPTEVVEVSFFFFNT